MHRLKSSRWGPVYYRDAGTLAVWNPPSADEAKLLEAAVESHRAGAAERLEVERLRELEPALAANFTEALYLPGEGQVDNREVLAALALALEEAGVACHWSSRIEDAAMPEAGIVADCRGMGAQDAIAGLRGVRGEILRLHAPAVELRHMVRLIGGSQPIYLVPRAQGRMVVGATAYESEDRSPASVGGVMRLLSAAVSVLPALAEARILEFATQVRPAFPNRQPATQWDGSARILRINGLYRHGFLLSPALVEEALAALAVRRKPPAVRS
jgi:glycine oxidase